MTTTKRPYDHQGRQHNKTGEIRMRDFKLYLEGAEVGSGHEPMKFDTNVRALDEHHAREIARRVYGYFTLALLVEIMPEVSHGV